MEVLEESAVISTIQIQYVMTYWVNGFSNLFFILLNF